MTATVAATLGFIFGIGVALIATDLYARYAWPNDRYKQQIVRSALNPLIITAIAGVGVATGMILFRL